MSPDACNPSDIVICAADSSIKGWRLVFQEYELYGTMSGRNRISLFFGLMVGEFDGNKTIGIIL